MEISSVNQAYVFLAMVLCGGLCTAVFDIFRAIRRYKNSGTGVIAFQDIVFWIIELSIVYMVAFRLNYAGVRAYEIVALVIGSAIYFVTLSGYVIKFFVWLIGLGAKALGFLLAPVAKVCGLFANAAKKVLCQIKVKCSALKAFAVGKICKIAIGAKERFWLLGSKQEANTPQNDNKLQN